MFASDARERRLVRAGLVEMRSKQQPRPSYRWLNTNDNGKLITPYRYLR